MSILSVQPFLVVAKQVSINSISTSVNHLLYPANTPSHDMSYHITHPLTSYTLTSHPLMTCTGRWHEALILFNLMETLGIRKDAAVYYTVISAVQSAAQSRRISEAKTRAWSESEGVTRGAAGSTVAASLTNGDTTKKPISLESKNAASVTTKLPDENAPASALFAQVDIPSFVPCQHTFSLTLSTHPLTYPINTPLLYQ